MPYEEQQFSIREVSERTGVKPVTLRAWQRRYNIIQPQRTDKGHRVYSAQDIETINEVQTWLAKGVAIGKVKALLGQEESSSIEVNLEAPLEELEQVLQSLADLNQNKLESQLSGLLKEYPYSVVYERLITPTLAALKQVKAPLRSLQYGLLQSTLIAKLQAIIESQNKAASKGSALFISFKQPNVLDEYLEALKLSERGYRITLINSIEDIRGLLEHKILDKYSLVYVYSDKSLTTKQVDGISSMSELYSEKMEVSETLKTLYFAA